MMLFKNTKVKVRSPDENADFFDIAASVLQGDTLAPNKFIICQNYVFRTSIDLMKENYVTLEKARSRRYPARTITVADILLMANTPAQAESLLHNPDWAAGSIGLQLNVDKTEYMCFNQSGNISTLNGGSLKLVD